MPVIRGWGIQPDYIVQPNRDFVLHAAAQKGNTDSMKKHLKAGAQVDRKNRFGATPLHTATAHGQLNAVALLLKFGAKPEEVNFGKQTALHMAAMNGHVGIVTLLMENGAEVNPLDDEDWTPLDCALWSGKGITGVNAGKKKAVADLLLKNGGKRNSKFPLGESIRK